MTKVARDNLNNQFAPNVRSLILHIIVIAAIRMTKRSYFGSTSLSCSSELDNRNQRSG